MLEQIPPATGAKLMVEWGLPSWPQDLTGIYYFMFNDCGVFAIHENDEGGIDGHMAMRKDARRYSRQMCREFIEKWGHLSIRVPVLMSSINAKNVVLKMGGFVESPPELVKTHDGQMTEIVFLRRAPNGRYC